MLRVNIGDYMSPVGKNMYESFMKKDDNDRAANDADLTDQNFFDQDKRYPWVDIKNLIMKAICCKPRKGDKVTVFRTTLREDNTVLPLWIADVVRLADDAANEGNAYKTVTKDEAMLLATRWVMPTERDLL